MGVMLRTYARRLAEVAGAVGSARQRDEVAQAVVQYLELVVAKNMTKVGWIADRLGNHSLPKEFVSDVLIELCLHEDDPNKLTVGSVGKLVVGEMYRLHPRSTLQVLDMLANTSLWDTEGFDVQDQPACMKQITGWVTSARLDTDRSSPSSTSREAPAVVSFAELIGALGLDNEEGEHDSASSETLSLLADTAEQLAQGAVDLFFLEKTERERRRHSEYFGSETSQLLLTQLLGGVSVRAATRGSGATDRVAKRGLLARPETLEFASWLASNASKTAKERLEMCFNYSSVSSNTLDSFATQIQGMVSQVQGFLGIMMKYATPAGIEKLEADIQDFVDKGMKDVMSVVERRILTTLNASSPEIERAIHKAARQAGERLGSQLGSALGSPLGAAMVPALKSVVTEMTNGSSAANSLIGASLGQEIGQTLANLTAKALAKQGGDLMEQLVEDVLVGGSDVVENMVKELSGSPRAIVTIDSSNLAPVSLSSFSWHSRYPGGSRAQKNREHRSAVDDAGDDLDKVLALVSMSESGPQDQLMEAVSGVWNSLVNTLKSLMNTLPTAVSTLKSARKEVSKLHSNLNSIFEVFETKGPQVFDTVAWYYKAIWSAYFFLMLPLNLAVLYYGFWACGYFGGPEPLPKEDEPPAPASWRERCSLCVSSSSRWLQRHHDTTSCFWSVVLFLQIIVLLVLTASIVLCIMAGVKALILAGCQEVYVLTDDVICSETLGNLRSWLGSFEVDGRALDQVCVDNRLLTCDLIQQKMVTSTILTTAFSLVATVLSLQLIVDSAILHEQARWRRMATEVYLQEASAEPSADFAASSSGAS
eukprot:SRR837773.7598.p1 GENE.SRR837773.7598~~SRR837773.7598.p1  ORF type:complete len:894 (+),score=175.09 SRR837773.7598:220-2682(+)